MLSEAATPRAALLLVIATTSWAYCRRTTCGTWTACRLSWPSRTGAAVRMAGSLTAETSSW